ncbi:MAG: alpha/beta hydrolase [Chloroflexi bacterium]|nr:alpha/beta hydrolase [Chloroflexota bacterium]
MAANEQLDGQIEKSYIDCGGITLHVITAGPADGDPVLLLHGFPEFWYGWRHQIAPLAAAGLRVIAPDQRGYNLSDKPAEIAAYTLDLLARDIVNLIAALGYERVHIVGHDWGAAVAWELAEMHAPQLKSLSILNVPHTRVTEQALRGGSFAQIRKSRYMLLLQLRGIAERRLQSNDFAPLINGFLRKSAPGTFRDDEIAMYREAWSQPGALTGMLSWYRAASIGARKRGDRPEPRITVPTQILWGAQDAFVEKHLAEESVALCEDAKLTFFPDAGHFVQHEQPAAINQHVIDHLRAHGGN